MTRSASLRTVILAALALVAAASAAAPAAADDGPSPNSCTSCHGFGGAHVKR